MSAPRRIALIALTSALALSWPASPAAEAGGEDGPLPEPGYARKLREAAVAKADVDGLELIVRLIPDVYRYEMALAMEELHKRGSTGTELLSKLRSSHRKSVKKKRNMLLLVEIRPRGGGHLFISTSLKKHFRLEHEGKKKTFVPRILTRPEPKAKRWEVFEYPPNQPRRLTRRALVHLEKPLAIEITARRPSGKTSDPISLSLAGMARQEKSADPGNSINARLRQISCVSWDALVLDEARVRFFPRKYKKPAAPRGFDTLLDQLEADG